jgi:hypothetical protein
VLGVLLVRRRREHQIMAALVQRDDQLARALERADLVDQLAIEAALRLPDRVALLALGIVTHDRGNQLVAAHADVTMDSPDRRRQVVLAKRAIPRDRMLVVRVDERPVDVE